MSIANLTVASDDADTRLDRWFRRHFPQLTQGALQKMLRTGQIRVDGKRAEANDRLNPGMVVRVPPLPEGQAPKAAPRPVDERQTKDLQRLVLYRDEAVIAIDKPHGLAVQGGPGITKHLDGMLEALRFDAEERPRLVHRLDRDTSGVLLLARTAGAASKLAAAFRGRDAEKTYWAVVVGEPVPPEGRIEMALTKAPGTRGERMTAAEPGALDATRAVTDFRTLDVVRRRAAWLELKPLTGRTHQLRVHCLEALGAPILGDGKYGGSAAHMADVSGQLHLHARTIRLPHPLGGTLEVSAPLPPHMAETFAYFGFEAPRTPKSRRIP
ncbi:23S rRNA pseudouridine955/2504/2580 synthase [Humitalea rosea]|uniref:Pseudouridine synthase n=1 Tax=Humitalea rosea TaxID=990373 RepID=A0A2W7KJS9_9PROT|nr:RluA family pseudouridine synthase [Humitalea rosea]PZW48299.1 23S rRNA pseudouridine955/2504/2580 synthase [Humitalea rosea]